MGQRVYLIEALSRYWSRNSATIYKLPIRELDIPMQETLPPAMRAVRLPEWASDLGIDGMLLVPAWAVADGAGQEWEVTDWIAAAFWYLNGCAERAFEDLNGPIHSYSFRLKGWDTRIWERAWVNRIGLFLRRWAAFIYQCDEEPLLGPLPKSEIMLTHDVDAVWKTWAIRFKQSAFHGFNAARYATQGDLRQTISRLFKAIRFLLSSDDYWCFERIINLENRYGIRSCFNFYGGPGGWQRSFKEQLFDPAYNITMPRLRRQIQELHNAGWQIGLHQAFDTWQDVSKMAQEKILLESVLNVPVEVCRQHWLRFSWHKTWQTQQTVGFKLDTTLGFNNKAGFRNAAALDFHPWDFQAKQPMQLIAVPMILMDSHLYDYAMDNENNYQDAICRWIDEVIAVRGKASIIWHQRVMSKDYSWYGGYEFILDNYSKNQNQLISTF